MKRMLSTIIAAFVLMNCIVIAHAEESQTEDTPQESATMVTSLDELQTAIAEANDGDTIVISESIVIENNCSIGTPDKRITLICADGFQGNMIKISGANIDFTKLTFDGSNGNCPMSVISCKNAKLCFDSCMFYNNRTVGVYAERGSDISLYACDFRNNGQVISMRDLGKFTMVDCTAIENTSNVTCFNIPGSATISNCLFQNNKLSVQGGVLMITATPESNITDCRFIGNTTDTGSGAAIYTSGITTISNCFFSGNRSGKEGNDICVWGGGTLNITDTDDQLAELYGKYVLQYTGVYEDEQNYRYNDVTNPERIELPLSNYVGALCFVSEKIPDQQPDSGDSTESQDPNQSTEPDDTEEGPDNPDDTDNEESTEGNTPEPPEETEDTTPTEPEGSVSTMPTEPDNTTPTNPGATEDTVPTVPDEIEDTIPSVPDETENTTPTAPVETPSVPEASEETPPPTAPSEPENTEPTDPDNSEETMPTVPVVPDETLPNEDEGTESTSPSESENVATTEPESTEGTIPEETDGTIPTETESSTQIDTTDDYLTDDQDHTQYIYYIPQAPATTNTEPSATESSVTEDNQNTTQPNDFIESEEVTPSTLTPEAAEIPQESAGGNTEVDIVLQELRVLVTILLVVEVLQIVCLLIIWAVPKVRSAYKGRYKR